MRDVKMIMWTIQPYSVYQQLVKNAYFYCDPNKSANWKDTDFRLAYQWMIKQLEVKAARPCNQITTPLWAWYRSHDYRHQRPDFRWSRDYSDEVCIEFDIPEEKVLLSDFEAWHFVLNNWYYSSARSKEEWEQDEKRFDSLSKIEQQHIKERSWQQIFDITPRHGEWTRNGEIVQGCFWLLRLNQVRRVWRLKKGERVHEICSV